MIRYLSIALVLLLLAFGVAFRNRGHSFAQADNGSRAAVAQPTGSPAARPGTASSAPSGEQAVKPALSCKECHAPGKALAFLGGALFHADIHKAYDGGFHAKGVQSGRKAATCLDCHANNGDTSTFLPSSDPKSTTHRLNLATTCGKCHGDSAIMQGTSISNRPFLSYQESVHARAMAQGNVSAAVCTDCHDNHEVLPASDARSPIAKARIPSTCGKCHASIAIEFNASVHGQAVARGVSRSPGCTDCHGIHGISQPTEPSTRAATEAIATGTCTACHEGVTLTKEFGVAGQRVSSYKDSYHGLASKLGSKTVANCASCHGVHNILPSSDARSMISQGNLQQTCGQCHPGATASFASSRVHLDEAAADTGSVGVAWVRRIYMPLIFLTIGGMLLHNFLIWRKKAAEKLRLERRGILRLTLNQRVQHWLLLTSFITLVISGFALQYPDSWLGWILGSSEPLRRITHRIAAVVMLVAGVYHIAYLAATKEGREWLGEMVPKLKDARDVVQSFAYYLGGRTTRPRFGRFGYTEKAEYWAVVWGTVIMGLTGLMIWFKISVFGFLARWWIDIAIAVHFYEAVLATLAIIAWHFYHVIFDPDVYPVNWAFVDGNMSEERYREEHELDTVRLGALGEEDAEQEQVVSGQPEAEPDA